MVRPSRETTRSKERPISWTRSIGIDAIRDSRDYTCAEDRRVKARVADVDVAVFEHRAREARTSRPATYRSQRSGFPGFRAVAWRARSDGTRLGVGSGSLEVAVCVETRERGRIGHPFIEVADFLAAAHLGPPRISGLSARPFNVERRSAGQKPAARSRTRGLSASQRWHRASSPAPGRG